jgi:hypothetical protein
MVDEVVPIAVLLVEGICEGGISNFDDLGSRVLSCAQQFEGGECLHRIMNGLRIIRLIDEMVKKDFVERELRQYIRNDSEVIRGLFHGLLRVSID